MKKIYILAFAFLSLTAYSQVNIPASSSRGTILTQTDQKIEYSNLKYEKGKVVYTNIYNGQQEFLYDNSVKSIEEKAATAVLSSETKSENSASSVAVLEKPKLTDKTEIKRFLLQENNPQYKSGKSLNNIGTAFLVGGATCFVVGGAINLSSANKTYSSGEEPKGSPVPLIIGLVGMGVGVVMKISGHSQMKKAVENYQNSTARKFTPSYYALNNQNGVGLMMKF
ncbi:hypothetical protein NZ698_01555 [Chryseobacterium sp. PBS4-4]|uniref:Uncharacterized protein n=1 Tax=Chryseobacterium edaphi TaxID=2976532 RepID=A0ABT2W1R8_9FLAO|nr:hypothetical protein [Chryseobacterium edaphi]MCU7615869.1 hypothetical protein [Chryseobacterium edaphi]